MEIRSNLIESTTIEKFANKNGLVMEVHERRKPIGAPDRFFAHFHHSDIKEGAMLIGTFGNGSTPEEAIQNYAKEIGLKLLVIDAVSSTDRKEIQVPRLTEDPHP